MSAPRASTLETLALVLGALLLASALFVDTTRTRSTAGFWRRTSHDPTCVRDPSWRDAASPELVPEPFHAELLHATDAIGHRVAARRCDVYRGYLVVREPSRLSLEAHATGTVRVVFGKQQLLELEAGGVRITRRVERPLPAGSHLLELRSEQDGELAFLRLSALLEPEARATTTPLASRALLPLDHDALAPSQADADRVRRDSTFVRRSAPRLALLLLAIAIALLLPGLDRSLSRGAAGLDVRALVAITIAITAVLGWLRWPLADVLTDPHALTHGARAWRTLWLGLPTRSFVDSIPAMGATEWASGAAYALGGDEGPRVLALAVIACTIALTVSTAHVLRGTRLAAVVGVALVAWDLVLAPITLDRGRFAALGLACVSFVVAWLATRTRVGSWLARPAAPLAGLPRSHALATTRATRDRALPWVLGASALAALGVPALGIPLAACAPLLVLVIACAASLAADEGASGV
jgi:hypothetical protein